MSCSWRIHGIRAFQKPSVSCLLLTLPEKGRLNCITSNQEGIKTCGGLWLKIPEDSALPTLQRNTRGCFCWLHRVLKINLRNWLREGNIGEGLVREGIIVIAFFLPHSLPVDSQTFCFRCECSPACHHFRSIFYSANLTRIPCLQFLRDCDLCSNSKSKIGRSEKKQSQSSESTYPSDVEWKVQVSSFSLSQSAPIKWWLNWFREVSVHDCNPGLLEVRIGS